MADGVAVIFGTGARRQQTPVDASGTTSADTQDTGRDQSPASQTGTSQQDQERADQEQYTRAQSYAEAANERRKKRLARFSGRGSTSRDSGRS